MGAGRPLKYKNVADMQKLIDEYFAKCDVEGRPYTITGLALALDMGRQELINYEGRAEYMDTVKRAKAKVQAFVEEKLFQSGIATGVIFNLKNNFGWQDKQEIEAKTDNELNINIKVVE